MSITTKAIGLALTALLVGGAVTGAIPLGIGTASAADAHGETYASITEIENSSQTGEVKAVYVSSAGEVNWDNLNGGAETVTVTMEAKNDDGEYEEFATRTFDVNDSGESGMYTFGTDDRQVRGELLENTSYDTEDFSAATDGATEDQKIPIRVTVTVTNPDGIECVIQDTHKLKTSVTNLKDPTVNGDTGIDGEIIMDDDECLDCQRVTDDKHTETETEDKDKHTDDKHSDEYDHKHDGDDHDNDHKYGDGPNDDIDGKHHDHPHNDDEH